MNQIILLFILMDFKNDNHRHYDNNTDKEKIKTFHCKNKKKKLFLFVTITMIFRYFIYISYISFPFSDNRIWNNFRNYAISFVIVFIFCNTIFHGGI